MRPSTRRGGGVAQVLRPETGELEVRIQARPETVFEFFVDPEKMRRWKGTEAELDPRPGGTYRVGGIAGGATVVGEFVEIDPPRRLVFTWGWEGDEEVPPGSSTVEVTLTPDGDATVLHLVHRDLPAGQGRGTWRDGSTSPRGSPRRRRVGTRGRTPGRCRKRCDGRLGRRKKGGVDGRTGRAPGDLREGRVEAAIVLRGPVRVRDPRGQPGQLRGRPHELR